MFEYSIVRVKQQHLSWYRCSQRGQYVDSMSYMGNHSVSILCKLVHPRDHFSVPVVRIVRLQDEVRFVRKNQKLAFDASELALCESGQRDLHWATVVPAAVREEQRRSPILSVARGIPAIHHGQDVSDVVRTTSSKPLPLTRDIGCICRGRSEHHRRVAHHRLEAFGERLACDPEDHATAVATAEAECSVDVCVWQFPSDEIHAGFEVAIRLSSHFTVDGFAEFAAVSI